MGEIEKLGPDTCRYHGEVYTLAPNSYNPDDEASIIAAIETVRAQVAAGPPPTASFETPSGEARRARRLKKLAETDPTQALLITTGLKK